MFLINLSLICYLLQWIDPGVSVLHVLDAGIVKPRRGDVGMIFYITIQNTCKISYHVVVKMIRCCENLPDDERDCETMQLIGGDMGILPANITRNVSLIYPNLYLHDRIGQCLVAVYHRGSATVTKELKVDIPFNTTVTTVNINPILRSYIVVPNLPKSYYNILEAKNCENSDFDSLKDCAPVNCEIKYSGHRNYYDKVLKRCVEVPECISNELKSLPNIAYIKENNKCRDLENVLAPEDIKLLQEYALPIERREKAAPRLMNLHCHHGAVENNSGFCVCEPGWASTPFNRDLFERGDVEIHMCTINVNDQKKYKPKPFHRLILILGALGIFVTLAVVSSVCFFVINSTDSRYVNVFPPPCFDSDERSTGTATWNSSDFTESTAETSEPTEQNDDTEGD